MAFCEFCGQQVPDGMVCSCPGAQAAAAQAAAQGAAPAPQFSAPAQTTFCEYCGAQIPAGALCSCPGATAARQMQPQGNFGAKPSNGQNKAEEVVGNVKNFVGSTVDKLKNGDKNTKTKIIAIAAGAFALLVTAFILIFCVSWGYKGAVKDLAKGIQKADYERIMEACMPDDYIDQLKEEEGKDGFKDEIEEANERLEERLEDKFGDHVKCTIDIRKKTALTKKALEKVEEYLIDEYGTEATVKKGYKLKVRITIKGSDDHDADTGMLYVVKLGNGGGGWKVVPDYGEDAVSIPFV